MRLRPPVLANVLLLSEPDPSIGPDTHRLPRLNGVGHENTPLSFSGIKPAARFADANPSRVAPATPVR